MTALARVGAECRKLRENAGVSLRQMAVKAHRDPGALSRFETGQARPRDIEQLVAAYRSLQRRTPEEAQPPTQQPDPLATANHQLFYTLYIVRWAAFAILLAVFSGIGGEVRDKLRSDELRIFITLSYLGLVFLVGRRRVLRRGWRDWKWGEVVIGIRSVVPSALITVSFLHHFGRVRVDLLAQMGALCWIEFGYWAWEFGYYRTYAP